MMLVTGATGFIGRALVRRLAASGEASCLLVRPGRGRDLAAPSVLVRETDLGDPHAIRAALEDVEPAAVIHLAGGRTHATADGSLEANRVANFATTVALLDAVRSAGSTRFVLASTVEVYGCAEAPFNERQPPEPSTPYAAAKLAAEVFGSAIHRSGGPAFAALRFGVVYGPDQAPTMFLPELVEAAVAGRPFAMTSGEQTRDFLYVDDAADALLAAASAPEPLSGPFNVGYGASVRLRDLAAAVLQKTGGRIELALGAIAPRNGDAVDYSLDTSAFRDRTGWSPRVSLDEGLDRTIAAARARLGSP